MRKFIVVITLATAPLVAAAPAAATAGHQAAVSSAAAVVTAGRARDGLAHPPAAAPPAPQVRDAATPRKSADTKSGGQTAVLPRHHRDAAGKASAVAARPAQPAALARAGGTQARAPPTPA